MRRIADAAQVTTGALYNHFANKAVLFDALVQAPAEEMLGRFAEIHEDIRHHLPAMTWAQLRQSAHAGTDWMLDYVYEHFDVFRLIFCRSEGTRWAAYPEELIAIEERAYRAYCDSLGKDGRRIEDVFLHINADSGFRYLIEVVAHDLPYEQAAAVMDSAKRFGMGGWQALLGRAGE